MRLSDIKATLDEFRTLIMGARAMAGVAGAAAEGAVSTVNSAAVVAAASIVAPAATDLPLVVPAASGRFLVSAVAFVRHSAVDIPCVFQLIRDPAGAATLIGPAITSDSSHVQANASATIPPFIDTPGAAVHKWALRVSTASGTVQVLAANEALVTVQELVD